MEEYGIDSGSNKYEFHSFEAFMRKENIYAYCKDKLLIVDEAHNLRTLVSEKTGKKVQKILLCSSKASKVLLLTATPMVNKTYDLNNLLALVKGTNPLTEYHWNNMYNNSYSREAYLNCMFSVYSKEQGDKNYPKRIDKEIELEMTDEYYKEYKEIEDKNVDKLESFGMGNPWAFISGLRIALLKIENSAKIEFVLKEVKKKVKNGKKVIIYSNFVGAGIKTIGKKLEEAGIDFYEFTGKTSKGKRKEYVDEYNNNEIQVLLITKAAAEGIDLKETNAIFIMDPPWNDAMLEQAIGRAIRYKSHINLPVKERYVEVYTLYNIKPEKYMTDKLEKPSADSMIKHMIADKKRLNTELIGYLKRYSIEENKC
jgi:SNF2 family DNA or RNA helicase